MDLLGYLEESFDGTAEAMIDDDLALRLAIAYLGIDLSTLEGKLYNRPDISILKHE